MSIVDLKEQLKKDGLLEAHVGMSKKQFVQGEMVFKNNKWENAVDVYGIYCGEDGRFCFFITDSERGIPEYSAVFVTENDACESLIKKYHEQREFIKKIRTSTDY